MSGWWSSWWSQANHHLGQPPPEKKKAAPRPSARRPNAEPGQRSEHFSKAWAAGARFVEGGPLIVRSAPAPWRRPRGILPDRLTNTWEVAAAFVEARPVSERPPASVTELRPNERISYTADDDDDDFDDDFTPPRSVEPVEPHRIATPRRLRPVPDVVESEVWSFINDDCIDPFSVLINCRRDPEYARRITLGMAAGELRMTDPDTSALVLGPPQGGIGKSAACIIPAILTWLGPCVSVSTKSDVFVASSWVRRRQGEVWSISFDGSPKLPGTRELRWTPISDDWDACFQRSEWMVNASVMASDTRNKFWTTQAADLLAPMLFYAGITGRDMRWLITALGRLDLEGTFVPMIKDLNDRGYEIAATALEGIIYLDQKTRGSIVATASVILRPFRMSGALDLSEDPNFSMAEFARGDPEGGSLLLTENRLVNYTMIDGATMRPKKRRWRRQDYYRSRADSVYIVVSEENMGLCAPLIQGFMADVQRAIYAEHRRNELAGNPRNQPVLWALDELASCPLPVHKMLRDCGSQGLQIVAGLQSLTQGEKLGPEGKDLVSLFGSVIALPGIRDVPTLEILSKLIGNFDQEVWGGSFDKDDNWQASQSWQNRPRLAPDDIYRGNPNDPDAGLVIFRNTWTWLSMQAYFRTWPWPVLMLKDIELFMTGDPDVVVQGLPMPQLMRNGRAGHLAALSPTLPEKYLIWQRAYVNYLNEWHAKVETAHEEALLENASRDEMTAEAAFKIHFPTRDQDDDE